MVESIGNYGVGESSKQRSVKEQRKKNQKQNEQSVKKKKPYYDQENLIKDVRILCLKRKHKLVAPTVYDYREPMREKFGLFVIDY